MYMYIYGLYIPGALSRKGAGACEPVAVSAHAAQLRRMRGVACTSAASWLQPRGPCGPGEGRLAKDVWRGTAGEGRREGLVLQAGEGRLVLQEKVPGLHTRTGRCRQTRAAWQPCHATRRAVADSAAATREQL
jgi:hypothetical protein